MKNKRVITRNKEYDILFEEGNAVRKLAPERREKVTEFPVKKETEEERRERHRKNRENRQTYRRNVRDNENAFTMSVPYVIFLSVAVIAIVVMCIKYLNINAEIIEAKENITALESQIDTLSAQNDALDYEINGYIDVNKVLKTAVEELGMINASEEQIKFYNSTDIEYMKQYGNIPERK